MAETRIQPGNAIVNVPIGLCPIGGTVNGVCQMAHHKSDKNRLTPKIPVEITQCQLASVETYGGSISGRTMVVQIKGREGWYMANAFQQ